MIIEVLYFAVLRDLTGVSGEHLELDDSTASLGALLDVLSRRHPALAGRLASVRVARNETFATLDSPLAAGDVIALIPPVAGG